MLLAAGGLIVLHQQGLPSSGGVNFYISAAPVLVAIPAAVLVIRLSPLVLRGLLRIAAARPGVTAFVGFARAARASLAAMLPAFALVLALTVVAFGFMVRTAVLRGQAGASWQATGADAVISLTDAPGTADAGPAARHRGRAGRPRGPRPRLVTPGPRAAGTASPSSWSARRATRRWRRARRFRGSRRRCWPSPPGVRAPGTPAPALASPGRGG